MSRSTGARCRPASSSGVIVWRLYPSALSLGIVLDAQDSMEEPQSDPTPPPSANGAQSREAWAPPREIRVIFLITVLLLLGASLHPNSRAWLLKTGSEVVKIGRAAMTGDSGFAGARYTFESSVPSIAPPEFGNLDEAVVVGSLGTFKSHGDALKAMVLLRHEDARAPQGAEQSAALWAINLETGECEVIQSGHLLYHEGLIVNRSDAGDIEAIAYLVGPSNGVLMNEETAEPRRLYHYRSGAEPLLLYDGPARAASLRYSSDGAYIALTEAGAKVSSVILSADGEGAHRWGSGGEGHVAGWAEDSDVPIALLIAPQLGGWRFEQIVSRSLDGSEAKKIVDFFDNRELRDDTLYFNASRRNFFFRSRSFADRLVPAHQVELFSTDPLEPIASLPGKYAYWTRNGKGLLIDSGENPWRRAEDPSERLGLIDLTGARLWERDISDLIPDSPMAGSGMLERFARNGDILDLFSPDGRYLVFSTPSAVGGFSIIDLEGGSIVFGLATLVVESVKWANDSSSVALTLRQVSGADSETSGPQKVDEQIAEIRASVYTISTGSLVRFSVPPSIPLGWLDERRIVWIDRPEFVSNRGDRPASLYIADKDSFEVEKIALTQPGS